MARARGRRSAKAQERYEQTVRRMADVAMRLADGGYFEDAERRMVKLVRNHLDVCVECPCLLRTLGLLYVDMLKLDEAERAARMLFDCAGIWDGEVCRDYGRTILTLVDQSRELEWKYGTAVQLNVPDKSLREKVGKIGGFSSGAPGLLFQKSGGHFRVVFGDKFTWAPEADLRIATVVVQLSMVVEEGAWRAHGYRLSGEECAQFPFLLSELNADSVRRELARGTGCEPCVLSIVLPGGEVLPEGHGGDAALKRCAEMVENEDKAKKRDQTVTATSGATPQKAPGPSAEDQKKSNESRVADSEKISDETAEEKQAAQCSSAAARRAIAAGGAGEASASVGKKDEDSEESEWSLVGESDSFVGDSWEAEANKVDADAKPAPSQTDADEHRIESMDSFDAAAVDMIQKWGTGALDAAAATVGHWQKAFARGKKRAFTRTVLKEFLATLSPDVAQMPGMAAAADVAAKQGRLGRWQISEVTAGITADVQALMEVKARCPRACATRAAHGARGGAGDADKAEEPGDRKPAQQPAAAGRRDAA